MYMDSAHDVESAMCRSVSARSSQKKLWDQFQKKMWANKLVLRRRLYSLKLKEGDSVQEHIHKMTEIFEELAVIGERGGPCCAFASKLTWVLQHACHSPMEVVTEHLLNEERKQKDRADSESTLPKAMPVTRSKKIRCYHCKKLGNFKRDCRLLKQEESTRSKERRPKANKAADQTKGKESDYAMLVSHALQAGSTGNWIVDSGATCSNVKDPRPSFPLNIRSPTF